ncbi:MAG: hypothetical protein ABFQ65_00200 [Nanoarchaeota archaeon]
MVTKVEAIKKVIQEFGGVANWKQVYENIEKYYPAAKVSKEWKAGIRGVLYREIRNKKNFKKVGLGLYALEDYKEENILEEKKNKIKIHNFIQGVLVETGNREKFETYTPDKSRKYKENIHLFQIQTLREIPEFTYPELIGDIKWIDVLWFSKETLKFPIKIFEVIDSIGTLSKSLSRCLQLRNFNVEIFIVAPKEYKCKYNKEINKQLYNEFRNKFRFIDYDLVKKWYKLAKEKEELRFLEVI